MVWLALVLLALLGAGVYWLLARRRPARPAEDEFADLLDSLRRNKKPKP